MHQCQVNEQYHKRLTHRNEYREDELSNENEHLCKFSINMVSLQLSLLVCEVCKEFHHGDCPVH